MRCAIIETIDCPENKEFPRSPCNAAKAQVPRRRFASLAAAAHPHRASLKTGFFNDIDVKQSLRMATKGVGAGEGGPFVALGIKLALIVLSNRYV